MLDRLDSLGCCGGSEGGPMCYALQASWSLPRSWLLSVFPGGTSACWRKGTSLCNGKDGAKVSPGWDLLSSSQLHQGQQLMCVGLISAMVMEEKSVILIFFFSQKVKWIFLISFIIHKIHRFLPTPAELLALNYLLRAGDGTLWNTDWVVYHLDVTPWSETF